LGLRTNYVLNGCENERVIGEIDPVLAPTQTDPYWTRGERGWGSGPAAVTRDGNNNPTTPLLTNFQQNPAFSYRAKDDLEVTEAAADMFLNWVYRVQTWGVVVPPSIPNSCTLNPIPSPDTWSGEGFLNRNWVNLVSSVGTSLEGGLDPRLPGDVRYREMHQIVLDLFSSRPSW